MTKKETILESVSNALFESVIINEISAPEMYDRYYKDKVPEEMYEYISEITGANSGGGINSFTTFFMNIYAQIPERQKEDPEMMRYCKLEFRRAMDEYNEIKQEDIKNKIRKGIKSCKGWSEFENFMEDIRDMSNDRKEFRARQAAVVKLYEDKRVTAIAPLTFEAAQKLGNYSCWCTSKHERDFYHYCTDNQWVVMLQFHDPDDEFTIDYQAAVNTSGKVVHLKDENDEDEVGWPEELEGIMAMGSYIPADKIPDIDMLNADYPIRLEYYNKNAIFERVIGPHVLKAITDHIGEVIQKGLELKPEKTS